jgi:predicted ATP-grasp superfamily ATP-dependent carboligase
LKGFNIDGGAEGIQVLVLDKKLYVLLVNPPLNFGLSSERPLEL